MSIELANESGIEICETELINVANFALTRMGVHPAAELSMIIVDNSTMADLHMRWMDLPGPTDVMSFPMDELDPAGRPDKPEIGPMLLGDIVLCPEFAQTQAEKAGHSLEQELALLTIHGVLHLLGYDHVEPEEEREMFTLQQRLLEEWLTHKTHVAQQHLQALKDQKLVNQIHNLDEFS